jgi:hypothetical protein
MGAARTLQRRTSGHAHSAEARSPAARPRAHRGTLTQDDRPDRAGAVPAQATGAIRIDIHTGASTRPPPPRRAAHQPPTPAKGHRAILGNCLAIHIRFRFDTWGKFFLKKIELRKFPPLKSNSFTC